MNTVQRSLATVLGAFTSSFYKLQNSIADDDYEPPQENSYSLRDMVSFNFVLQIFCLGLGRSCKLLGVFI